MIKPELLSILCCPETHQALTPGDPATLDSLNRRIATGRVHNRAGRIVEDKVEDILIREDRRIAYPIRDGIPVLLIDEGLPLDVPAGE